MPTTSCFRVSSTPLLKLSRVAVSTDRAASRLSYHGQQFVGEMFDRIFVGVGDIGLSAFADVFRIGLGAQPGIVVFLCVQFGLLEHFFHAGHGFDRVIHSRGCGLCWFLRVVPVWVVRLACGLLINWRRHGRCFAHFKRVVLKNSRSNGQVDLLHAASNACLTKVDAGGTDLPILVIVPSLRLNSVVALPRKSAPTPFS